MTRSAVVIDTRLNKNGFTKDASGFKSSVIKFGNELGTAFNQSAQAGTKAFEATRQKIVENSIAIDEVRKKMAAVEQSGTEAGNATSITFEKAQAKLLDLNSTADTVRGRIDEIIAGIRDEAKLEFSSNGITPDRELFDDWVDNIVSLNPELKKLNGQLGEIEFKIQKQSTLVEAAKDTAVDSTGTQTTEYKRLEQQLDSLILKQQQLQSRLENPALLNNTSQVKKATAANQEYAKSTGGVSKGNGGILQSFVKLGTMLKMMVIRTILRGMINAIRQGFRDLAQVSEPFNNAMSQIQSQFQAVRNSIATAFAPIMIQLVPIITTVTNAIIKCMNAVAAFIAALSGQSTYYKATVAANDYAASISGVGSAAKEAEKQLASFDTIEKLSEPNTSSGGGGGGANAADMFEEADIPYKILEITDAIKNAFEGIGNWLTETFEPDPKIVKQLDGSWSRFKTAAVTQIQTWWKKAEKELKQTTAWDIGAWLAGQFDFEGNITDRIMLDMIAALDFSTFLMTGDLFGGNLTSIGENLFVGLDYLEGIISGWFDGLFDDIDLTTGWTENIASFFSVEKWSNLFIGVNEGTALGFGSVSLFSGESTSTWWDTEITPWFTKDKWSSLFDGAKDGTAQGWGKISSFFSETIPKFWDEKIKPWFTKEKWAELWDNLKTFFSDQAKELANSIIDRVNSLIDKLNSFSFEIPAIPGITGGGRVGGNIPKIPRLAQGAVIPANKEFMAVLGDQKNGTNLEAPENLIRQIFREELAALSGGTSDMTVNLYLDDKIVARALIPALRGAENRVGLNLIEGAVLG